MDLEAQNDELVVLSSIYEDFFSVDDLSERKGGELRVNLDLPDSLLLTYDKGLYYI